MLPFESIYVDAVDDVDGVTPELVARLKDLYETVGSGAGAAQVKPRLVSLLEYLVSPAGLTDANCRAVDFFFCLGEWSWDALPKGYQDLFADMGGGLHEAVAAPDIAEILDATPAKLLDRARALPPRR